MNAKSPYMAFNVTGPYIHFVFMYHKYIFQRLKVVLDLWRLLSVSDMV